MTSKQLEQLLDNEIEIKDNYNHGLSSEDDPQDWTPEQL